MADEPLLLKVAHRAELFICGHLRIDAVQLPQVDAVQFEPLKAAFQLTPEIFRAPVLHPTVGPGAFEAAFRRNDEAGVRVQGLRDQLLGYMGAIGIGSVDEVHPQFDGTLEYADRFIAIPRWAPDPFPGEAHRAEAHTVDGEISAEGNCPAGRGGYGNRMRGIHEGIRLRVRGQGVV